MPGFIDIASFPTSDGALHQVYANVHEETSSKLSLDFDHAHLRSLLRSLRSRNEEVKRRMGRRPYDVTLGVYNHPSVDGDSMGLALVITEHIASYYGAYQPRADGSLALESIPHIIATGDIDLNGKIKPVGGMDAKLTGILHAIESEAISQQGIFIYPIAENTVSVNRLIREIEAKGWKSWAVGHIDDVVPIWQPILQRPEAGHGAWTQWRRPLAFGAMVALTLTVIAILISIDNAPEHPQSADLIQREKPCAGLSNTALAQCLVGEQLNPRSN